MESKGQKLKIVECRMVGCIGDIFAGGDVTDDNGKPVLDDKGQPRKQWTYMLAINKQYAGDTAQGGKGEILRVAQEETAQLYPNGSAPRDYGWKIKDGDSNELDKKGNPYNARQGYPGHWIVTVSSYFPPEIYDYNVQTGEMKMVSSGLNCGDYYQAVVTVKSHGPVGRGKPGLYINIVGLMRYGHGEVINTRINASKVFSEGLPTSLPQGAFSQPSAPQTPAFGGGGGQQQSNPFGQQQGQPNQGMNNNPFGGGGQQQQTQPHTGIFNPQVFGGGQQQSNPFGQQQGQPNQGMSNNPFGGGGQQQSNPFGQQQGQPNQGMSNNPFGGGGQQQSNPFGQQQGQPNQGMSNNPFGTR